MGMHDIARILQHAAPTPPADLLIGESLKSPWLLCCPESLQRVEPQWYCRGRLCVVVPGSAFAARLRQEMPSLMARLRKHQGLQGLSEIVIRVVDSQNPRLNSQKPFPARRSLEAARCLVGLARATADPELKASLDRLATTIGTEVKDAHHLTQLP